MSSFKKSAYDNASAPKQDQIAIATAVPMPPSVANGSAEPDFGMPRNYTNKTTTTTVRQIQIPKRLGSKPKALTCPYCETGIITRVKEGIDGCTITFVVLLFLIFWPLFWIPLVCTDCKSKTHFCPNCGRELGETGACSN